MSASEQTSASKQPDKLSPYDIRRIEESAKKWFQYDTYNVRLLAYRDGAEYATKYEREQAAQLRAEVERLKAENEEYKLTLNSIAKGSLKLAEEIKRLKEDGSDAQRKYYECTRAAAKMTAIIVKLSESHLRYDVEEIIDQVNNDFDGNQ